jgi:hypothetical protein
MKLKNIGYGVFIAATAIAFVIGSSVSSEAKSKKKMAAPPPPQEAICFTLYKPVCAVKAGMKFTYANSCYATQDGAKVVSEKACPVKKAMKPGKKKMAKAKKEMKKKM